MERKPWWKRLNRFEASTDQINWVIAIVSDTKHGQPYSYPVLEQTLISALLENRVAADRSTAELIIQQSYELGYVAYVLIDNYLKYYLLAGDQLTEAQWARING